MTTISGTPGDDLLTGTASGDVLLGLDGNDTLLGGAGFDLLHGGAGNDSLDGGATDTGSTTNLLSGGAGADTLTNGLVDYQFDPSGIIANLSDTAQTAGATTVAAHSVRDGYGATDTLGNVTEGYGSNYADVWFAGDTQTFALLYAGDDEYFAGSSSSNIVPGSGSDTIHGGAAFDYLLYIDQYPDASGALFQGVNANLASGIVVDGWGYVDTVSSIEGIAGSRYADILAGDGNDNQLYGAEGNDTLQGGAGSDGLTGGEGRDTAVFSGATAGYQVIDAGNGMVAVIDIDPANGNEGTDSLVQMDVLRFADSELSIGSDPAQNDVFDRTGPGGGTVAGGTGDDLYIVDDPLDNPVELPGQGVDTVRASISWILGEGFENLELTGSDDLSGTGNSAGNRISGNSGRNALDGGAGADTLLGGAGGDTYYIDDPLDQVIESASAPATQGAVAALLRAGRLLDGIQERPLDAAQDADTIVASLGRAVLSAFVESGVLAEGSAAREVIGNILDNSAQGNSAGNLLQGGGGNDTLTGGAGLDVAAFSGLRAAYVVIVNGDSVTVTDQDPADGNEGVDTLTGIEALRFADALVPLGSSSVIEGGEVADTLSLDAAGAQLAAGSAGNDTYLANAVGDAVVERADEGIDTVKSSDSWTLWEHVEHLVLTGVAAIDGAGNSGANRLTGNAAQNLLLGYAGNDTLEGGAAADTLRGGTGDDLYVAGTGDLIDERADEGVDSVQSAVSWTLGANLEKLVLSGGAAVNGTGNTTANLLTGNSGINRLDGGGGNDTLSGGAGADSLVGGAGNDTYLVGSGDKLTESAGGGVDSVQCAVSWTLAANVEKLTLTGSKAINGTGSAGGNTLTGNAAANQLKGAGGKDILAGGGGNDLLAGGAGNDKLSGGTGADAFLFDAALNAVTNKDTITDFAAGNDKLRLDDDVFAAFNAAQSTTLAASALHSGAGVTTAADADDRILYNSTTGALYYDADGTGSIAPIQFAILGTTTHSTIAASDFVIVA